MLLVWLAVVLILIFGLTAFTGAPYVPSHRSAVKKAFYELRPVGSEDVVVDIGSGDGTVLRQAAERGAKAFGIEINPLLVLLSLFLCRHYKERISVQWGDFRKSDFPAGTTVVYTFGDSRDIAAMYQKVQRESDRCGRPLDFISYGFAVAGVEPVKNEGGYFLYRTSPLQMQNA